MGEILNREQSGYWKQNNFDKVLVEVEKELLTNIKNVRVALDFYNQRDSIINRIFYDSLTAEDYSIDRYGYNLMTVTTRTTSPTILTNAFNKLIIDSEDVTDEQDSVTKNLTFLYNDVKKIVDDYSKLMWGLTLDNLKEFEKYSWFSKIQRYQPFQSALSYFLNDTTYISRVSNYALLGPYNHRQSLEVFDVEAVNSYGKIHKYLTKIGLINSDFEHFMYNVADFEQYEGIYLVKEVPSPLYNKVDSVQIIIEGDKINQDIFTPSSIISREMIPGEKYFRTKQYTGFYRFEMDDKGKIIGYTWSNGVRMMKMYKAK